MVMLPVTSTAIDDYAQTKQFLKALDPLATNFLFMLIPCTGPVKVARHMAADAVYAELAKKNAEENPCNIYVCVNETNHGKGYTRTRDEVTKLRCIYVDDDGKTSAAPYPLEPTLIIETSPGKKQVYWMVDDAPLSLDQWDGVQQTIVNLYGGDPNARDAARVLRVPGYANVKYEGKPACHITADSRKRYTWQQILDAFPPSPVTTATGRAKGEALDLKATLEQFISGENYHEAGIALVGYYYNAGMTDGEMLVQQMQSLMDIAGDSGDPRFQQRREKDMPGSVNWIVKERAKEDAQHEANAATVLRNIGPDLKFTQLPMPGGGLYDVTMWVLSLMRYPNETIAIMVAEHLVSVFGGGRWHLLDNTTTRKRILLALLGTGKNVIVVAFDLLLQALSRVNPGKNAPYVLNVDKFEGTDCFSFSVQHAQILEHRVRSFIINEAGESGSSTAGDVSTLRAYQLQALSTKVGGSLTPKKYSAQGKNNGAPEMKKAYGGVWVYFHESTIDSYALVLQNAKAFGSGDMSRSDLIFPDPHIHKRPGEIHKSVPDNILRMFAALANDSRSAGEAREGVNLMDGTESHAVLEEIEYDRIREALDTFETTTVKERNTAIDSGDTILISMLARRFERTVSSVLVCALADAAKQAAAKDQPVLSKPAAVEHHLTYAVNRVKAIDETVLYHTRGGGDLSDNLYDKVYTKFLARFKDILGSQRTCTSKGIIKTKKGEFVLKWSVINEAMRGKELKELAGTCRDDTKQALYQFIDYMLKEECLERIYEKAKDGTEFALTNQWRVTPKLRKTLGVKK